MLKQRGRIAFEMTLGESVVQGFYFAWKWITTKVSQAGIGGLLIK